MDISFLGIKTDIVLGAFLASIPTLIVSVIAPIILYKIQNKDQIKNKNAMDKLGFRLEIADLIKKVDDYCYEHYRDYQLYKDEAQPGDGEDISNIIEKIYFLIELHFPNLVNSVNEYSEIAYEYANHCARKENHEKYNKNRDTFLEKIRKDTGL